MLALSIYILIVHGDIRHLENYKNCSARHYKVHGDIRHLEIATETSSHGQSVHGDIRHLEKAR